MKTTISTAVSANKKQTAALKNHHIHYRYEQVENVKIFYREAGKPTAPTVILLHGFAASSYMWRNLIPALADDYHVIAPDLPAFGFTESPERGQYEYSFANITKTIDQFITQLNLGQYTVAVHDYGAPIAWRLAITHPLSIKAIVSQNGNAYEEGLAESWEPIKHYWRRPTEENRNALMYFATPASVKWQDMEGVNDTTLVSPDGYTLEGMHISKPGMTDIQLDLLLDYASNVQKYPEFQAYFRAHQPPLLAVWGQNDPFFLPAGAEAWKRDIPDAEVHFYDTGHFALETHDREIIPVIRAFLDKTSLALK